MNIPQKSGLTEIPFNRSSLLGRELEYIFQTMTVGQIGGDRTYSKKCQALLERTLGAQKALVTTSCTHALEISALLLDIQAGDEVIVPSFAFVSTANAFALRGARIVFVDVRPDTFNLDETKLEALITPRTKAVVLIHYAGVGCEMDCIDRIARRHGVKIIEDNAHGLFGKYPRQMARHVRRTGRAKFSRDKKHYVRRGWCAAHQRLSICRARRDHSRERHQPQHVFSADRWTSILGWMSAPATS